VASASPSTHVVVVRQGKFYKVDITDEAGGTLPLPELHASLQQVVDMADAAPAPANEAVGLLTGLPRDEWAALRERIEHADATNAETLSMIDSALFVLSLEADGPPSIEQSTAFFLHGDGMSRWLDKSFSLVVSKNGEAAINFEHSWGDGVAVLRFFNEIFAKSSDLPHLSAAEAQPSRRPPSHAPFVLSAELKESVAAAKVTFDATIARTELAFYRTAEFNSGFLKKAKLSPDGAMQMAFQLAHIKHQGGPLLPSTYESASTAAFKHGRTETIRSATPEAAAFTAAFTNPSASVSEKAVAMRAAVDNHSRITREALMGKGMDRHLFALSKLAEVNNVAPGLFQCTAMQKLRHIIVSTSTLNSEALASGGFGPVNDDCFAVGYGIRSFGCEARVMTYGKDSQGFADAIGEAMRDMREAAATEP
jgi:carnitine O-palmitoyltransferase 2